MKKIGVFTDFHTIAMFSTSPRFPVAFFTPNVLLSLAYHFTHSSNGTNQHLGAETRQVLTFTLTSQVIGTLQIPITVRILGQNSVSILAEFTSIPFTWTRCVSLATFECACVIFCADYIYIYAYIILFDIYDCFSGFCLILAQLAPKKFDLIDFYQIHQRWCFPARLSSEKSLSTQKS